MGKRMRNSLYQSILGFLIASIAAFGATAKPMLSSYKPACLDGLCLELIGTDLMGRGPNSPGDDNQEIIIDIYRGDDRKSHLARVLDRNILVKKSGGGEDLVVFDIKSPTIERIFINHGLYVRITNKDLIEKSERKSRKYYIKWDNNDTVICKNFEDTKNKAYKLGDIKRDFFTNSNNRGWIRSVAAEETNAISAALDGAESNKVLSIVNQSGRWGPLGAAKDGERTGGGLTFSALICASGDCNEDGLSGAFTRSKGFEELFMSYWIRFEGLDGGDFDFRRGGKLPGFAGGHTSVASGGGHEGILPDGRNGWSARATFAADGRGYQYLYHPDNSNPLVGDRKYGENRSWMLDGKPFHFASNRWYRVLQHIKMNSIDPATGLGRTDGVIHVWIDNDLVLNDRARFRHGTNGAHTPNQPPFHIGKVLDIDTVAMGLFHGGGTPGHAPTKDVRWLIDDFLVFEPLSWTRTNGCSQ